jgi:hypothetical protein
MSARGPTVTTRGRQHRVVVHGWKRLAWIAPYVALWVPVLVVLKAGAVGTDCSTICMVAHGWLWYTVVYAALSLTSFVGAVEILVWMIRLDRVSVRQARSLNH